MIPLALKLASNPSSDSVAVLSAKVAIDGGFDLNVAELDLTASGKRCWAIVISNLSQLSL